MGNLAYGMDDADGSTANGANVRLWNIASGNSSSKQWQLIYDSGGWYKIRSVAGGTYLESQNGAIALGANVDLYSWNSEINQEWGILHNSDSSYTFVHRKSGLYLDVEDSIFTSGTNIGLWASDGYPNQKWRLVSTSAFYERASVSISGDASLGSTLQATASTPLGSQLIFHWRRATDAYGLGSEIAAATTSSYTLTADDLGQYVFCVVSDASGTWPSPVSQENATGGAYSESVGPVGRRTLSGAVTIEGRPKVGSSLYAIATELPADARPSYSWVRDDDVVVGSGQTYTPTAGDYLSTLTCEVTDTGGTYAGTVGATTDAIATRGIAANLSATPSDIAITRPNGATVSCRCDSDGTIAIGTISNPAAIDASVDSTTGIVSISGIATCSGCDIEVTCPETAEYAAGTAHVTVSVADPNIDVVVPTEMVFDVSPSGSAEAVSVSVENRSALAVRIRAIAVAPAMTSEDMTCTTTISSEGQATAQTIFSGTGTQEPSGAASLVAAGGSQSLIWSFTNGVTSRETLARLTTAQQVWGNVMYTFEFAE